MKTKEGTHQEVPEPEIKLLTKTLVTKDNKAVLYVRMSAFLKQLQLALRHFPHFEKYALVNQIRLTSYNILDKIVECQKKYTKKTSLEQLDILHEQLRYQLLLSFDLGYFRYYKNKLQKHRVVEFTESRRYLSLVERLDEIGRLIGGWIKAEKDKLNNKS